MGPFGLPLFALPRKSDSICTSVASKAVSATHINISPVNLYPTQPQPHRAATTGGRGRAATGGATRSAGATGGAATGGAGATGGRAGGGAAGGATGGWAGGCAGGSWPAGERKTHWPPKNKYPKIFYKGLILMDDNDFTSEIWCQMIWILRGISNVAPCGLPQGVRHGEVVEILVIARNNGRP